MNPHLTDQQLNAYLHQTLHDAQRETLDAHLTGCPACRARLNEWDVLQQRVRRELAAELRAMNVPLSLTFETIIPRLQPSSRTTRLRRYSRQALLGMTAVAALLVVMLVLANTSSPTADRTGGRLISETGRVGGWYIGGDDPGSYEFGLDQIVAHTGGASGFIRAKVDVPSGFGALMQQTAADSYHGQRVRLSAYLKTEGVEGKAELWLSIDGPQGKTLRFENMDNRPIQGTTDWQKYDLVLNVPSEAISLNFGTFLMGRGQVWIDNVQLEAVGQEVALTAATKEPPLAQPANLDFEAGLEGWSPESTSQNYTTTIDTVNVHGGQASGHIQSQQAKPIGVAALSQYIKAVAYHGKRLRVTAYIKFEKVDATAHFVADAFDAQGMSLTTNQELLASTSSWQVHTLVFDVPENSDRIAPGIILKGEGQIWIDDVQLEVVGTDVALTFPEQPSDLASQQSVITGHDLDGSFTGWNIFGSRPQDYEMGFDENAAYTGKSSAYVKSIVPLAPEFGTFAMVIDVNNYRGKRVRFSGYVKADQVENWAGLWMRVDGPEPRVLNYGDTYNVLSFDNMQNRPIQGTHDWQKYEVVLDVPEDSVQIAYGILLDGKGQVWLDDVQLEVVDQSVPTTGYGTQQPTDLDFEIDDRSWAAPQENTTPVPVPMVQPEPLAYFGDRVALTDAQLPTVHPVAGEPLELSLHWMVSATNPTTLNTFVHVIDSQGNIAAQSDQALAQTETSVQTITLQLPATLASGTYQIVAGVYDTATGSRLTTNKGETTALLDTIDLVAPIARFGNVAMLVDTLLNNNRLKPGETLTLDLSWNISQAEGYTSFVQVLDAQEQLVAQADLSLAEIQAKGVRGQPNAPYLISQSKIPLPANLPDGAYHLAVGVYDNQTGQRLSDSRGQTAAIIAFEVRADWTVTADTKHVHLVNNSTEYVVSTASHFEVAIRNACADLGCETQPITCVGSALGGEWCSPYSAALTVTVYIDPKATALYGWTYEDQVMFKVPTPSSPQGSQSIFEVPDSLSLLVEKVARSVYGWPPQQMNGLAIFYAIVDWEAYQLNQRLGNARLANPFQPDRLAGTPVPPLESLWVSGPNVSVTSEMQAEAAALIEFVEKEYGALAVSKLLKTIGQTDSLPNAIESSLNLKYSDFEQRWRDWLKQYDLQ